ncbi:hypothetical protein K469DRAFT_735263 [Zopfia rhizophila CBS 207.26]|uniref:Fumarylacetoacetase-like C-terminal domain-containing protein n=1 Tax=Zopfia rhizophila CBS 207.26 TaxID=1314779 RepID=A0A6A6EMY3_9PEZI|nr:hypothetical protein K469DRAFT_735263 [Zopfia rhizophila CBS 207.26]
MEKPLVNYISYVLDDGTDRTRTGHLDAGNREITPLTYASGTPLSILHEQLGKNYSEHAKEFNVSGYDASDKVDMLSHPVVFTKRTTSIFVNGEEILPLLDLTSTLDYEGEIGVIIDKGGHKVSEGDAGNHIWGYTIINDVTAREKQRDHKQFYVGKSRDTFCPMGPIAAPAKDLPKVLKGTTDNFIFSVPTLIATLSKSQTLQPGDVIATGTPAGVGFGLKPPKFLQPGDLIEISVIGLGTLCNKFADPDTANHVQNPSIHKIRLTTLNTTPLYTQTLGLEAGPPIVFVRGLGGTSTYYQPLITTLNLRSSHRCVLYDLEGHGLSPTKANSIQSYTSDLHNSPFNWMPHRAHTRNHTPSLVRKLILIRPPPNPLPEPVVEGCKTREKAVRDGGMRAVAETVATAGTSSRTRNERPLAYAAVLQSLLGVDSEGYAKGCTALAGPGEGRIEMEGLQYDTLVVAGSDDTASSVEWCQGLVKWMKDARLEVLSGVGHLAGFEDVEGLGRVVGGFL